MLQSLLDYLAFVLSLRAVHTNHVRGCPGYNTTTFDTIGFLLICSLLYKN